MTLLLCFISAELSLAVVLPIHDTEGLHSCKKNQNQSHKQICLIKSGRGISFKYSLNEWNTPKLFSNQVLAYTNRVLANTNEESNA